MHLNCFLFFFKVDLDESTVLKLTDVQGLVTKYDFVKLGQDLKLLDFGGAMGEKRKPQTPRKERSRQGDNGGGKVGTGVGLGSL